jgi:uncharacterized protein YciI
MPARSARTLRLAGATIVLAAALSTARAQSPVPAATPAPAASPAPARTFALVFRAGPAWDKSKSPGQQLHFADHSANIRRLREEGRLSLGGRFSDVGLLLVKAADEAEARSLVERDPSVKAGVFTAEVHPFATFAEGCVGR